MEKYLIVIHQNGKIQNVVGMYDSEKDARNMILMLLQDDMYIYPDELKKYVYPVYYGNPIEWIEIEQNMDIDDYHLDFFPIDENLNSYCANGKTIEIIKENELKIERE
jgi:hypothetical protein